jgi:fumarate hydratase class II
LIWEYALFQDLNESSLLPKGAPFYIIEEIELTLAEGGACTMADQAYRTETDSMGEMRVPAGAYWGAQTQRAVENFPISTIRWSRGFIETLGMLKKAAARANMSLGLLEKRIGQAIEHAASEVMEGRFDDQFVVDIFQTGSGTSTNMNANEVIASRSNELLGGKVGSRTPVHPNDHVNMGQSSNDVIPSCIHVAALKSLFNDLIPAMELLRDELQVKSEQFDRIVKIGRTHLQDATPLRLGQEFGGYLYMVKQSLRRVRTAEQSLCELAIGGTAVGTGINTHPDFAQHLIGELNSVTKLKFREAANHFEAQGAKDAVVETSGILKTVAVSMMKIANDIRWLGSGPRCGIGELILPAVQPGSSIMPGKVNPVIAESLCQVAAQVIGNDATVAVCGLSGNFELNVMMPVMAHNLLQSIAILSSGIRNFAQRCIRDLQADMQRIDSMIEQSLALCTSLSPIIGYDAASKIAKEAHESGKTIREVATERGVLPKDRLNEVLDPWSMTEPA